MKKESGTPSNQLWLIGDSNPKNWDSILDIPLDPRHPAIHNIWTPIYEKINEVAFQAQIRLDGNKFYIRNAIENPNIKPQRSEKKWTLYVNASLNELTDLIKRHKPIIVFSFGAFSFEFCRRAIEEPTSKINFGHWGSKELGEEFKNRVANFEPKNINLIPLLHATIARGKFIESHNNFTNEKDGNYFIFTGQMLGKKFVSFRKDLKIWV
jgi:hypothetical protein